MAREAAEATVAASYECGVADTEARLTEEVAGICRDYVTESWGVAMDRAAVPANSDLSRIENIFFPEDIRDVLGSDPSEEPRSTPVDAPDSIIPEGKGGNEEAQPPAKDKSPEDAFTIRDVVAQVKDVEPKPTAGDDRPEAEGAAKSSTQDKV